MRRKMIATMMGLAAAVIAAVPANADSNLYSRLFRVHSITWEETTLIDSAGHTWVVRQHPEDWWIGDYASAVLYDRGTPDVLEDDAILSIRFERPDIIASYELGTDATLKDLQ